MRARSGRQMVPACACGMTCTHADRVARARLGPGLRSGASCSARQAVALVWRRSRIGRGRGLWRWGHGRIAAAAGCWSWGGPGSVANARSVAAGVHGQVLGRNHCWQTVRACHIMSCLACASVGSLVFRTRRDVWHHDAQSVLPVGALVRALSVVCVLSSLLRHVG